MRTVGEYLPVQPGGGRTPIPAIQPFVAGPGCASINVAGSKDPATDVHVKRVDVTVQSPSGCDVTFNQFANPFLGVESRASIKIDQSPQHTIAVHVPPGTVEVTLFRRSLIAVVAHELVALLRR
jgi:hypothetical protein